MTAPWADNDVIAFSLLNGVMGGGANFFGKANPGRGAQSRFTERVQAQFPSAAVTRCGAVRCRVVQCGSVRCSATAVRL